jgi:hypothetical protein
MLDDQSLADAGLWADQIRGYPEWDFAKPWHYMNVPDAEPLRALGSADNPDVLWAIVEMQQRLRDPKGDAGEQAEALKFLIHLVADIHQPLHVGRKADRGGNRIKVRFQSGRDGKERKSNLHRYWDSDVIKLSTTGVQAYTDKLLLQAAPKLRFEATGEPFDWAVESKALRDKVYDFQVVGDGQTVFLGAEYRSQALSVLALQLTRAGLRLAVTLDNLYCDAAELKAGGETRSKLLPK